MDNLIYKFAANTASAGKLGITTGVVNSGNLEVLITYYDDEQSVQFNIITTVPGYDYIWQAVLSDFAMKYDVGGLNFVLHDSGATPAVVSLRLRQAYENYINTVPFDYSQSIYLELSARERVAALVDADSFNEYLKPGLKFISPHLSQLNLPTAFDDGVVIGEAKLDGATILIAAQNYAFMGGAVGEINGAKLTGLCLKALATKPRAVIFLLDSGGVRLQEANVGEIAISEIIACIMQLRYAGIPVYGIVAGRNGAFGGVGIISQCLDQILITENGRTGVSGPEVIETVMGSDEYDASDRALVWRTCGGRERASIGDGIYVGKSIVELRAALINLMHQYTSSYDLTSLEQENLVLHQRINDFATCQDGADIWAKLGFNDHKHIPDLSDTAFIRLLDQNGKI